MFKDGKKKLLNAIEDSTHTIVKSNLKFISKNLEIAMNLEKERSHLFVAMLSKLMSHVAKCDFSRWKDIKCYPTLIIGDSTHQETVKNRNQL